ncbi:Uncharacterized protein PBTT_05303 [Plasmodiophora brassicae]|uniref:Uncharacterized protein n=1 Tax=Plasmodiophora brassicae TaxID=37360 RepID=A0A0G4IQU6_PLABS|nr:hypothetical protein PBRA_000917 [Plasmodiophora brassicae]
MSHVVGPGAVLLVSLAVIAGQLALAGKSIEQATSDETALNRLKFAVAAKAGALVVAGLLRTGLGTPRGQIRYRAKERGTLGETRDFLDGIANSAAIDAGAEVVTGFVESKAGLPRKVKAQLRKAGVRTLVRAAAGGVVAQGMGFDGKQHFVNSILLYVLNHIVSSPSQYHQ